MGKEGQPENNPRLLVIDEQSAQLGRLLLHTSQGNPEFIDEIITESRKIEDSYLAYESVRTGLRAGFIVGNLYSHDQKLPYTGLEPYTVGSGLTPEEVVRLEVSEGLRLIRILNRTGEGYFYQKALRGEKTDPQVIKELAAIYGGLVARFRAVGDSDRSQFRSDTYTHVKALPDIVYSLSGQTLDQTLVVPRASDDFFPVTRIDLAPDELKGYSMAAQLGRFGHPLVRETVRRLD